MNYWIAMNALELQISLLLLEKTELPGLIEIDSNFSARKSDLDRMIDKGFFKTDSTGTTWNPFVKTVLWTAANAQSELRIEENDHIQCRLYFYDDTMIFWEKDFDEDLYIFYYVPLLPKAIGGVTQSLEQLELLMSRVVSNEQCSYTQPLEPSDGSQAIVELLSKGISDKLENTFVPVCVDGWCFGEHSLESVLVRTKDEFQLVNRDDKQLTFTPVGFYDFVQNISRWIVRTHGQSIAEKEKNNG